MDIWPQPPSAGPVELPTESGIGGKNLHLWDDSALMEEMRCLALDSSGWMEDGRQTR